jgi:hypothetical protein
MQLDQQAKENLASIKKSEFARNEVIKLTGLELKIVRCGGLFIPVVLTTSS